MMGETTKDIRLPKKSAGRKQSHLELAFYQLWSQVAAATPRIATLEQEVRLPPRRYMFDFRIPHTKILIEVQGGTYSRIRMGHSSGEGLNRDYKKANYAQMQNYQVFYFDRKMINVENIEGLWLYAIRTHPHLAD
jgi:very-short-patch-repair endonuclease